VGSEGGWGGVGSEGGWGGMASVSGVPGGGGRMSSAPQCGQLWRPYRSVEKVPWQRAQRASMAPTLPRPGPRRRGFRYSRIARTSSTFTAPLLR